MEKVEILLGGQPRVVFTGRLLTSFPWKMNPGGGRRSKGQKKVGARGDLYELKGGRVVLVLRRKRASGNHPQGFFFYAKSLVELFGLLWWKGGVVDQIKKRVPKKRWTLDFDKAGHRAVIEDRGGRL